jgi:hypothetical protein
MQNSYNHPTSFVAPEREKSEDEDLLGELGIRVI